MSYSYMKLSDDLTACITEELTSYGNVIDIQVVDPLDDEHFAVAFAAVRMPEAPHQIEAVVCLLKKYDACDGTECMIEEIFESEGPAACFCPDRILNQLSQTTDIVSLSWRQRCRALRDWDDKRWADELLSDLPQLY